MAIVNLDTIVRLVRAAGIEAHLEKTDGRGVIYAGTVAPAGWDEDLTLVAVAAGPGYPSGADEDDPWMADTDVLSVGRADDGFTEQVMAADAGAVTEEHIARLIVAFANRPDPDDTVTADALDEAGLDSTLRGIIPTD